jgi:hypothetical protein
MDDIGCSSALWLINVIRELYYWRLLMCVVLCVVTIPKNKWMDRGGREIWLSLVAVVQCVLYLFIENKHMANGNYKDHFTAPFGTSANLYGYDVTFLLFVIVQTHIPLSFRKSMQ